MPFEVTDPEKFRDMIRMFSTNVNGRAPLYLALKCIPGIGRRFGYAVCRAAQLSPLMRAGSLTNEQVERLSEIIQKPDENGIPVWMLNRRKDRLTGTNTHWSAGDLGSNHRTEIERLKKMKCKRGMRHAKGLKVRGQCTKSTGRRGGAIGVERKK